VRCHNTVMWRICTNPYSLTDMPQAPDPKPSRSDPVGRSVRGALARFGELWALPEFSRRVEVSFSRRLQSRVGRAVPPPGTVTIHAALANAPRALLHEVLCHEAAHVAVFRLHGPDARPHGPEWAALVCRAGYQPVTKLRVELPGLSLPRRAVSRYEHLCPLCQVVRIASRPIPRWRCQACVEVGLPGELEIRQLNQ
jgi:predicted SprT family Zn-dependent metalloprotease